MISGSQHQVNAFDTAGLSGLQARAGKGDDAAISEVAKQFEAMFVQIMLKSMRASSEGDPILGDSDAIKQFQDLQDTQMSIDLSKGRGLGIAAMIEKQMRDSLNPAPTHEARPLALDRSEMQYQGMNPYHTPSENTLLDQVDALRTRVVASPNPAQAASGTQEAPEATVGAVDQSQKIDKAATSAEKQPLFESPEEFVQAVWEPASRAAEKLGVDPRMLVAQAALETGWGKHIMQRAEGQSSFNVFGIKADQRWAGEKVNVSTLEYRNGHARRERADFRAYGSIEESFHDYAAFLKSNPRYEQTLNQAHDSIRFAKGLQQAGYATDPAYADKIVRIAQSQTLNRSVEGLKKI